MLTNGAAVAMPWLDRVPAVLETWLVGQAGGGAIAELALMRLRSTGSGGAANRRWLARGRQPEHPPQLTSRSKHRANRWQRLKHRLRKRAQSDVPHCKFHFLPRWSLWAAQGGGGGVRGSGGAVHLRFRVQPTGASASPETWCGSPKRRRRRWRRCTSRSIRTPSGCSSGTSPGAAPLLPCVLLVPPLHACWCPLQRGLLLEASGGMGTALPFSRDFPHNGPQMSPPPCVIV